MPADSPFLVEAIAEFTVGLFIASLRLFTRWKLVGFKKWGGDEYFSIAAMLFWTVEIVPVILVGRKYGSNTGWTDEQRAGFDEATIRQLETGSKLVFVGWLGYLTALWSLKASMLFFYNRVTSGLFEQKIVRGCAIYCVISYLAVFMALFLHCRPFHKNWQVYPDPGRKCNFRWLRNYLVPPPRLTTALAVNRVTGECSAGYTLYLVVLPFNIVSDIVLVGVPIPILIKLQANWVQKLVISTLLCSGIFIVIAAFLRCLLAISSIDQINVAAIWAVRETFVAMVVVNAPALKPLFRLSTWKSPFRRNGSSNEYALSSRSRAQGSKRTQLKSVSRTVDAYTVLDSDVANVPQTFEVEITGKLDEENGRRRGAGVIVTTDIETRYEPV
ncbi:hypothetical protein BJX63DRAFT_437976 [Aspergillus granulosus]|uniref:Rhodopsin domain-containing protein n=1 Tax=Aspergillus granulosus TaxID=176169 RepID=A0ABR4GTD0_9EURO